MVAYDAVHSLVVGNSVSWVELHYQLAIAIAWQHTFGFADAEDVPIIHEELVCRLQLAIVCQSQSPTRRGFQFDLSKVNATCAEPDIKAFCSTPTVEFKFISALAVYLETSQIDHVVDTGKVANLQFK